MAEKDLEKQVEEDLEAYLTAGFNNLLDGIMLELGREGASEEEVASPVYTGFFASSWKVSNTTPKAVDKIRKIIEKIKNKFFIFFSITFLFLINFQIFLKNFFRNLFHC